MSVSLQELLVIAVCINLFYEILHSSLYETCREASLVRYVFFILKAAAFDGIIITLIYGVVLILFAGNSPFTTYLQIAAFIAINLAFAIVWEVYALLYHRWEYSARMPKLWGIGVTPALQLAGTGLLSLYIIQGMR